MELLQLLIYTTMLSILSLGFADMFVAASRQQAEVARKAAWTNTKTNISTILANTSSCTATITGQGGIRTASDNVYVQQGTLLAPQMPITEASGTLVGSEYFVVDSSCTQDGNSHNFKCPFTKQQVRVDVVAQYRDKTYSAVYYVNVNKQNGVIVSCL